MLHRSVKIYLLEMIVVCSLHGKSDWIDKTGAKEKKTEVYIEVFVSIPRSCT